MLHTSRQLQCRGACKISLWSVKYILTQIAAKFRHITSGISVNILPGNGSSPVRHQAMTSTKTNLLSVVSSVTNFSEILIQISNVSFQKMHVKISSKEWRRNSGPNVSILQETALSRNFHWVSQLRLYAGVELLRTLSGSVEGAFKLFKFNKQVILSVQSKTLSLCTYLSRTHVHLNENIVAPLALHTHTQNTHTDFYLLSVFGLTTYCY